jgi:hypothetical protein
VSTGSEGEDPRRYVVIRPATAGTQSTASDDEDAGDLLPDDDSDEFVASDPESGAS